MPISHHISKSKNLPATAHDSQPKLASQALKSAHVEPERVGPEEFKPCRNQNNDGRNINKTKNSSNKLSQTIPPAVATKDSSLAAIFPFELKENEAMFSGAALDKKHPITAIYIEATVNNTPIKLILDSGSAESIIMLQLVNQLGFKIDHVAMSQIITANGNTKLPYGKIDSFPFKINDIIIPTKVLVINATQYQALLLINYNGHQARILAICGHFQKPSTNQRPTFKFEKNPALPAIKTYQLSWADDQRTGLPAILMWTSKERSEWNQIKCSVCKKKLSSMTAYSISDKDPRNSTHYYCNCYNKEKYGYLERHRKWNEELCLTCGKPLPRGCDWNNIADRGVIYNTTCQYTILICDWVRRGMPFKAVFNRALKRLQHYSYDKDKLYNTAQAKSAKVANKVTSYNMFDPVDEFQDYYQQLCSLNKNKNNISPKSTLTSAKTVLSHAKISAVKNLSDSPGSEKFIVYTDLEQIKIFIANTTEESVYIPKDIIIGYLRTELENTSTPQEILNFPEIAFYCEFTSINWQQLLEYYQFMPEELAKLNIETMNPD
ncbi:hypothetical protein G9A89_020307 [Geosiphon pyriformis]|nr:hypothetical protein G9A89_020307 [Geosiphon pyriformis]